MAEVRRGAGCFDVRSERALLATLAQRDEHDEQLRHQGQTAAEATPRNIFFDRHITPAEIYASNPLCGISA